MLWWTLQNLAIAAILAGMAGLACRLIQLSPAARHALWLIVLLKLLTPPLVLWPWAISLPAFHSNPTLVMAEVPSVPLPVVPIPDADPLPAADEPIELPASPEAFYEPLANNIVVATPSYLSLEVLLKLTGLLWLIGSLVFAAIEAWRIAVMLRTVRRAAPADAALDEQVRELAGRLGIRPIAVRQASDIHTPMIWSFLRPTLLWPAGLSDTLSPAARQALLVHELAHVRRRDHWVGWLELMAGCVWWFNPLFWYVRYQLRENAELACDAWVVGTLPKSRRAYAEALLLVCERMSCSSTALAVGVSASGRRSLERRLTMILRQNVPVRLSRIGLGSLMVLLAAVLPAWSQRSDSTERTSYPVTPGGGMRVMISGVRATATAPAAEALPADAAAVSRRFEQSQAQIRAEAEAKIAEHGQETINQLQELQDKYTREAKLDEAVAIRDHIRSLRVSLLGGQVQPDPGSLGQFRDRKGQTLHFEVVGATNGYIWGTDVYTDDSSLATTAVHAGVLRPGQKGVVRVRLVPGPGSYQGSTRNGLTSHDYGSWSNAYRVEAVDGPVRTRTAASLSMSGFPGSMSGFPGMSGMGTQPRRMGARALIVELVGSTSGYVWGTNVYTGDSDPATAAVHAGVLQPGERGQMQMVFGPGAKSYEGSTRNGVTSHAWGEYAESYSIYRVAPPGASRVMPGDTSGFGTILPPAVAQPDLGLLVDSGWPAGLWKPGSVLITEVVGSTAGHVWGSEVYTADSSIAAAAVHAGVLQPGEKGRLKITFVEGRDSYSGSTRNGVSSSGWANFPSSFTLEKTDKIGLTR